MDKKQNCWEFMQCGKGPSENADNGLGACPVPQEERLNGIHGGINGGRTCWFVAGTLCDGDASGTFAKKIKDCEQCEFYQEVQQKESHRFIITKEIREILA